MTLNVLSDQQSITKTYPVYYHIGQKSIKSTHLSSWNQQIFIIFSWSTTHYSSILDHESFLWCTVWCNHALLTTYYYCWMTHCRVFDTAGEGNSAALPTGVQISAVEIDVQVPVVGSVSSTAWPLWQQQQQAVNKQIYFLWFGLETAP